jgi:hypothetical protein
MKKNLWLTLFAVALVANLVMMYTRVDGQQCTSGTESN